ncbi:MAG: hypothetical protein AAF443_06950 [Chlamydiota bacterium]
MHRWLFLFLIGFFPLFAPAFSAQLKEKVSVASPGDYAVIKQNKTYTLLHLHSRIDSELIFEEISIAAHQVDQQSMHWKEWVANGAPGHTSWILYSVDLEYNAVTECFSFTRQTHLATHKIDAFFTTLLNIELDPLPVKERIQRGSPQKAGQVKRRQAWAPPQYIEGKRHPNPSYDVFTAVWPCDGSEIAGKKLVFYFDHNQPSFPFPYWMQARSGAIKYKMHAVDSGKHLKSPQQELPRRLPAFHPAIEKKEDQVVLTMQAPYYYKTFQLYAIDTTASPRITHSIPFELARNRETITLSIANNTLDTELISHHRYLLIAALKDEKCYAEHPRLFTWTKVKKQMAAATEFPKSEKKPAQSNAAHSPP